MTHSSHNNRSRNRSHSNEQGGFKHAHSHVNLKFLPDFDMNCKPKEPWENGETGWQYMGDMIRATIVVSEFTELWDAYTWFKKAEFFKILKIKDKLRSDLKNITIIFDFDDKMIGELQIRFEDLPPQYHANHILYELERSNTHLEFI